MSDPRTLSAIAVRLAQGTARAADLARALNVSQPTLSRALRELERGGQVLRLGGMTRGARYAQRRTIAGIGSAWPLYRVDLNGEVQELGVLHALARDTYALVGAKVRDERQWEGLPWFLQDARPAGFLGRAVPSLHPELQLPARVIDWTDEHAIIYLTQRGLDNPGDLILGTAAMDRVLAGQGPLHVGVEDRAVQYPAFAAATLQGHPPGSSAHGEHPKFTAVRVGPEPTPVIVKFSPPIHTAVGRRWADLLHAEHLAHRHLASQGIPACRSQILAFEDRVFLECERFDRAGARGRLGTVTLLALDAARYGRLDTWSAAAQRLLQDGLLPADDAKRLRLCDAFGALVGNTDRHFGNVTLFDLHEGAFALAPVYDMLPMLFAPQDDQIVPRAFELTPSAAIWLDVYSAALAMAQDYWDLVARAPEISAPFREIAGKCARLLKNAAAAS
jgi:DNA-binding transcriptional ArsR family regulator